MADKFDWALLEEQKAEPFDWASLEGPSPESQGIMGKLNPTVLGMLQGAGDIGANVLNLLSGMGNQPQGMGALMGLPQEDYPLKDVPNPGRIPNPELGQYVGDSLGDQAQFIGGQLVPNVIGGAGIFRGLGAIPQLGKATLGATAGRGALTGAALSEDRLLGAGLGAATAPLSLVPRGTSKVVGNKIVGDFKNLKNTFSKKYNQIFQDAEKAGINKVATSIKGKDLKYLKDAASAKQEKALLDFIDKPTLKNAHDVQSSLGKMIRQLNTKQATKGLEGLENKALKSAEKAQEKIRSDIVKSMTSKGKNTLSERYTQLTKDYAKELGPYLDNSAIRKAALKPTTKGAIDPSRLPRKLQLESGDPFRAALGAQYPELALNKFLNDPILQNLLKGAGLGGAGYLGYDIAKRSF